MGEAFLPLPNGWSVYVHDVKVLGDLSEGIREDRQEMKKSIICIPVKSKN
jgi:hypothetical protein